MVAETPPLETRPLSEMERIVADGVMTQDRLRLLCEVVRRYLWERGLV